MSPNMRFQHWQHRDLHNPEADVALLAHQSSVSSYFWSSLRQNALKTPLSRQKSLSWLADTITKCDDLWKSVCFRYIFKPHHLQVIHIHPYKELVYYGKLGHANPSCNKHDGNSRKHQLFCDSGQIRIQHLRISKRMASHALIWKEMFYECRHGLARMLSPSIFDYFWSKYTTNTWLGFPGYKWDSPCLDAIFGVGNSAKASRSNSPWASSEKSEGKCSCSRICGYQRGLEWVRMDTVHLYEWILKFKCA